MIKQYFLPVLLFLSTFGFSQKIDLTESSPWFISPNIGGTWHTTDVKTMVNVGAGFTVGKSFMKKNASPVWIDLYGRLLIGTWKGQDIKASDLTNYSGVLASGDTNYKDLYNYTVHNFRTKAVELNLEMALHFNRIVHNTGWDPYIFGGIGFSFYRAYGNYLSDSYPYIFDKSYNSNSQVLAQMDQSYETPLDGNEDLSAILTGHLGLGIGYHFGPRFSMGIEHKTTFTGKDNFDGLLTKDKMRANDIYHYTSLYFKWYLRGKNSTNNTTTNPPVVTPPVVTPPVVVTPPCNSPKIDIQNANNQSTSNSYFNLQAFVSNAQAHQTQVTLNRSNVPNISLQNNGRLNASFNLYEGLNTITITSVNECGRDSKTIYVQYTPQCDDPIVTFTNTRQSRVSSTTQQYNYTADIRNIQRGNLVQVYVNGVQQNTFTMNYSNFQLNGTASLQTGNNIIQIVATNNCGTHTQVLNVEYNAFCPTPIIQFNRYSQQVEQSRNTFSFSVTQVSSSNQVVIKLNGVLQTSWTTQQTNNGLTFSKILTLSTGVNTISISATNSCGTASESTQIIFNEPCKPATIALTSPRSPNFSSSANQVQIQATITEVNENSDITLLVNGVRTSGFTYNAVSDIFRATVNLRQGNNQVQIIAKNDCSTVTENINISYTTPCETPNVNITSPANGSILAIDQTIVKATVFAINSQNQITVYVNGNLVRNFSLSGNQLSIPVTLRAGGNNIQIVVTNDCGSNTQTTHITYNHPRPSVPAPSIDFTSACNIKVEPSNNTFTGEITGVTNASQVNVLVNGQPYSNVNWNFANNRLNFSFNLRTGNEGTYTVTIIATNEGGSQTKTCTLTVANDPMINICYNGQNMTIKESQWMEYNRRGAIKGKCPEVAPPISISNMEICFNNVTLTILESQWPVYSARGAVKGKCPEIVDNDIVICLNENGKYTSLKIKESQWESYRLKGATLGECPQIVDNDIVICLNNKTMTIKESKWNQYVRLGATLGECPKEDPEITICHRVGSTLTTLTIKQSEWPNYQSLGATLGECPVVIDPEIVICLKVGTKNTTRTIKQSEWPRYQSLGATRGACPDTTSTTTNTGGGGVGTISNGMLICVFENGNYITKTIQPMQWPSWEARGATRGACTGNEAAPKSAPPVNPVQRPNDRFNQPIRPITTTPKVEAEPVKPATTPRNTGVQIKNDQNIPQREKGVNTETQKVPPTRIESPNTRGSEKINTTRP